MPFPKKSSYSPEEEQSSINEWCLKLIRMPEEHILVCRNWQRATVEHFVRRSFGIEFNETSHGSCTLHVVWVYPFDPKTLLEEIMNFFYPKCCDDPFARSLGLSVIYIECIQSGWFIKCSASTFFFSMFVEHPKAYWVLQWLQRGGGAASKSTNCMQLQMARLHQEMWNISIRNRTQIYYVRSNRSFEFMYFWFLKCTRQKANEECTSAECSSARRRKEKSSTVLGGGYIKNAIFVQTPDIRQ